MPGSFESIFRGVPWQNHAVPPHFLSLRAHYGIKRKEIECKIDTLFSWNGKKPTYRHDCCRKMTKLWKTVTLDSQIAGIQFFEGIFFYLLFIWMPSYKTIGPLVCPYRPNVWPYPKRTPFKTHTILSDLPGDNRLSNPITQLTLDEKTPKWSQMKVYLSVLSFIHTKKVENKAWLSQSLFERNDPPSQPFVWRKSLQL